MNVIEQLEFEHHLRQMDALFPGMMEFFFFPGVHGKKIQFFISKETVVQNDKLVDEETLSLLPSSIRRLWALLATGTMKASILGAEGGFPKSTW